MGREVSVGWFWLDADDEKPKAIVREIITKYELVSKTIVQNTPHNGLHLLVKIPCKIEDIETWRKRALYLNLCKDDCHIEIKTTTMGITLAPSRHRKDKHLSYIQEGSTVLAEVPPIFYEHLIVRLKSQGCIAETPEEYHSRMEASKKADFKSLDQDIERRDLIDSEITDGIEIILGKDDNSVNSIYVPHHRHNVVMSVGGYLYYRYITLESVKTFIQKLGEAAGDSSEDINNSLKKIDDTWRRGLDGQPILGKSGLIEAFARLRDGDLAFGQERLTLLAKTLHLQQAPKHGEGSTNNSDSNASTLVKIAVKVIPFFFTNHLNRPCAVVQVMTHYEVMEINTDPFLMVLRRIWQSANPNKIIISDNAVKHARYALIAKSINPEHQTIRTHLRVAWKEKNKILRYDLTNNLWQQIEISSDGVRKLSSKVMLDEIKGYIESGYDKRKVQVLFQRYSNTKEKVLPAEDFEPTKKRF